MQVDCEHGLHWSITRFAYFGRNSLIGYSIFRREMPFGAEDHANLIWVHLARNKQKHMGRNSNLKWLPLFSPHEARESDGTIQMWEFLPKMVGIPT